MIFVYVGILRPVHAIKVRLTDFIDPLNWPDVRGAYTLDYSI